MADKLGNSSDDDLLAKAIPINEIAESDQAEEPAEAITIEPEPEPIDLSDDAGDSVAKKIATFDTRQGYHSKWKRQPNKTGQGATHMRTFVCKLRLDAMEHLDEQVNEWLDENPGYEVKFVSTGVGPLTGKLKEDAMFMTVWV